MPIPSYTLADRFKSLLRSGLSPTEAAEHLETQWCSYHFHTVDFNLPSGCDWKADQSNNLTVTLPGGRRIDPTKIMTRPPGLLDRVPIPLSQLPVFKSNAELLDAVMRDDQPDPEPTTPEKPLTARQRRLAQAAERGRLKTLANQWVANIPDLKKARRERCMEECLKANPELPKLVFIRACAIDARRRVC